jgi:hypothetical protein
MEPPLARALKKALDDARGKARLAGHVASGGKFASVGDADRLEIIELKQNPHKVDVKITATFQCTAAPAPAKRAAPVAKSKKKPKRGKR